LVGTIFSGYYSLTKLFTQNCLFNESCPIVFGSPACYWGAIIFIALLVLSSLLMFGNKSKRGLVNAVFWVSLAGVLYGGYLTIIEMFYSSCIGGTCTYTLLLPTCLYGTIFYAGVLIFSSLSMKRRK